MINFPKHCIVLDKLVYICERLTDNIADSLEAAQEFLQQRAIANFASVDASYGRMVADKVKHLKKKTNKRKAETRAAPINPARNVNRSAL